MRGGNKDHDDDNSFDDKTTITMTPPTEPHQVQGYRALSTPWALVKHPTSSTDLADFEVFRYLVFLN